jgi:hypothetical protein
MTDTVDQAITSVEADVVAYKNNDGAIDTLIVQPLSDWNCGPRNVNLVTQAHGYALLNILTHVLGLVDVDMQGLPSTWWPSEHASGLWGLPAAVGPIPPCYGMALSDSTTRSHPLEANMRQQFAGHFRLTNDEIAGMWKEAMFVFDTNALLNLYRYTDNTRDELFGLMDALREQIHVPYQVMHEFFANRYSVISQEVNAYKDLEKIFSDAHDGLKTNLGKYSRHSHIDTVKLLKEVERAFLDLRKQVKRTGEEHPNLVTREDHVIDRLVKILDGKVGAKPSPEVRKEAEQWATTRIDNMVPPGYADKKKDGDRKLGDALIWREILELARTKQRPVIFVTDDVKEDWWLRVLGKTVSPLPQLKQEIFDIAGKPFHMYQVEQFMKYAGEFFGKRVASASLTEAAEVSARSKPKRPLQSHFSSHTHRWLADSVWHDVPRLTFAPNVSAKVMVITEKLQQIEAELKALRNEAVEPGSAMDADIVRQRRRLEAEHQIFRDRLAIELVSALSNDDSTMQTFYSGSTQLPPKRGDS